MKPTNNKNYINLSCGLEALLSKKKDIYMEREK